MAVTGVSERHEREFGACPHWRTKFIEWSRVPYCIDCGSLICHGVCKSPCWDSEDGCGG